jgi:hypothetical protein
VAIRVCETDTTCTASEFFIFKKSVGAIIQYCHIIMNHKKLQCLLWAEGNTEATSDTAGRLVIESKRLFRLFDEQRASGATQGTDSACIAAAMIAHLMKPWICIPGIRC